ncbi:MAG: FumA C-terminus/TtdB family hydratase beta subunit [Candidatus Bathyarchaeota archaeon]|nr:FumA C-terminus/TtdB family hydratase beta subunit [Candidatus Bathyarchaeota archaeon]
MAVYRLKTPISEEEIRKLTVNDIIYINGALVTARDAAHKRALEFHRKGKKLPLNLEGLAIFHCGPIVKKIRDEWILVAAGPTTSARMDLYEADFIKNFKARVIVGKGGMGGKTTEGMKKTGAVYGAFTGGAAVLAARAVKKVKKVYWLDLGMPEALWILEVENFGPVIVAIDSYGKNLFEDNQKKVMKNLKTL